MTYCETRDEGLCAPGDARGAALRTSAWAMQVLGRSPAGVVRPNGGYDL